MPLGKTRQHFHHGNYAVTMTSSHWKKTSIALSVNNMTNSERLWCKQLMPEHSHIPQTGADQSKLFNISMSAAVFRSEAWNSSVLIWSSSSTSFCTRLSTHTNKLTDNLLNMHFLCNKFCGLQCLDDVGWATGRASGLQKLSGGCWRGYLSGAMCRLAYGPADAIATHCLLLQ